MAKCGMQTQTEARHCDMVVTVMIPGLLMLGFFWEQARCSVERGDIEGQHSSSSSHALKASQVHADALAADAQRVAMLCTRRHFYLHVSIQGGHSAANREMRPSVVVLGSLGPQAVAPHNSTRERMQGKGLRNCLAPRIACKLCSTQRLQIADCIMERKHIAHTYCLRMLCSPGHCTPSGEAQSLRA